MKSSLVVCSPNKVEKEHKANSYARLEAIVLKPSVSASNRHRNIPAPSPNHTKNSLIFLTTSSGTSSGT